MATTMTIAEFLAAGSYDGDYVIADTAANFAALAEADIATIGAAGGAVTFDVAEDAATVSLAQVRAMVDAGIAFTAADAVTLAASADDLATAAPDENGEFLVFRQAGVDVVDVTSGSLDVLLRGSVLDAIAAGLTFADPITVHDDDDYLRTLSTEQVQALADAGVGTIATTDAAGILAVSYDWWTTALDAGLNLVGTIRIAEPGADLATRDFAALYAAGIRSVLAIGDFPVTLAALAAFNASGLMFYGSTMSIADTAANVAALTGADLDTLLSQGISAIAVTDGSIALSVAAFNEFASRNLVPTQGEVVIDATDAEFAGFTAGDLANFAYYGADAIGGADGTLAVSLAQLGDVRGAGLVFAADDAITLELTQAEFDALSAQDIADLATGGVDIVDIDGGAPIVSLTHVAATVDAGLAFAAADAVTLQGTAADLAAASGDFLAFVEAGVDVIDVTSGTLDVPLSGAVLDAIAAGLTFAGSVTVSGDSAYFQALDLAAFQMLADAGVTVLRSTDADDFFRVDFETADAIADAGLQVNATFRVVTAAGSDVAGADLQALSAAGFTGFDITGPMQISAAQAALLVTTFGVTKVDWGAAWTIEVDQASIGALTALNSALHSYGFTQLTADAGTVLEVDLAGAKTLVGVLFSEGLSVEIQSSGPLSVDMASGGQSILMHGGMTFADDYVATLTGTASSLTFVYYADDIARTGIDVVECTSGTAVLTLGWATTMLDAGVAFDGAFRLLLDANGSSYDTASASFDDYVVAGIDELAFSGGSMSLTVARVQAAIDAGLVFADGDAITLADTGANIAGLDAAAIAALAAANVDVIDVGGDAVTLSLATFEAVLSADLSLDAEDTVTIAVTAAEFAALSAQDIADLAAAGVVGFDGTGALTASLAQVGAMVGAGLTFAAADTVTLDGTAANLAAASDDFLAFRQAGVDAIDVTSGTLDVLLRGGVLDAIRAGLTFADPIVVHDDDDYFRALDPADFQLLADAGVAVLRSTDSDMWVGFDVATAIAAAGLQVSSLNSNVITAAASDIVDADLADLQALSDAGFNAFDITGHLRLPAGLAMALITDFHTWSAGYVWTVEVDQASMDGLSAAQITALFDAGFSTFAADGAAVIDVDLDQAAALTAFSFAAGFAVEIQSGGPLFLALDDTAQAILDHGGMTFADDFVATLTANASTLAASIATYYDEIAGSGIDVIACTSDTAVLSLQQATTLAGAGVAFDGAFQLLIGAAQYATASAAFDDLAAAGVDEVAFNGGAATLTVAEVQAAIDAGLVFTDGDTVTVADTAANIAALSAAAIAALAAADVDAVDVSGAGAVSFDLTQVEALRSAELGLTAGDTVTLVLSQASIYGPSASDLAAYAAMGVDFVGSSDSLVVALARIEVIIDAGLAFADASTVSLWDAGAAIGALSAGDITAFGAAGVDTLGTSEALTLSVAQIQAALDAGMDFSVGGQFRLTDDGATIAALTAGELADIAAQGVDVLHTTSDGIALTAAQAMVFADAGIPFLAADLMTVADTAANIQALSTNDLAALGEVNFDVLNAGGATDVALSVTAAFALAAVGAGLAFTGGDTVTVVDTAANIAALAAADIAALAAAGVDDIEPSEAAALTLTIAQALAIVDAGFVFGGGNVVTVSGEASDIHDLIDTGDLAALRAAGVDFVGVTEDGGPGALTITVADFNAVVGVGLRFAADMTMTFEDAANAAAFLSEPQHFANFGVDVFATDVPVVSEVAFVKTAVVSYGLTFEGEVYVVDSYAQFGSLTAADWTALGEAGIDGLDLGHGGGLELGAAAVAALAQAGLVLRYADSSLTISDSGANIAALTVAEIAAIAGVGTVHIDATDDAVTLTLAKATAFVDAGLAFDASDAVTMTGASADVADLSAADIADLAAVGIDVIDVNGSGAVTIDVDQALALLAQGVRFAAADSVTLAGTTAAIAGLSAAQLGALADAGIDVVDVTPQTQLALTVAQADDLVSSGVSLGAGDTVGVADTAGAIAAMSEAQIAAFAAAGIDKIDADGTVTLSVAQALAFADAGFAFAADDTISIDDSVANVQALTAADFTALGALGIEIIDPGTAPFTLNAAQAAALAAAGIDFPAGTLVGAFDTGAAISALTAAQITAIGGTRIQELGATGTVTWTKAQLDALVASDLDPELTHGIVLTASKAAVTALTATQLDSYAAAGVTIVDIDGAAVTMTLAQASALTDQGLAFAAADAVTMTLTATEALATSAADAAGFRAAGVDTVVVADTGAALAALSTTQIAGLATAGIDGIDATNDAIALSVAKADAFVDAGFGFVTGDAVIVNDTAANIGALSTTAIAALRAAGVDGFSSLSDTLSLTLAQLNAFAVAGLSIDAADVLTIADTGAALKALTTSQIATLDTRGVDKVDATDNALTVSLAQSNAYAAAGIALTAADTITLADAGATLGSRTASQIATLGAAGIDRIDATDNALTVSLAQSNAYAAAGIALTAADTVTLADAGATLGSRTASQIATLGAAGIDRIDATDNAVTVSLAQSNAYAAAGIALAAADAITLADTGATLGSRTASQIATLGAAGIDRIDATDNAVTVSLAQSNAYASVGIALAAADAVTLADTGATLGSRTASQIATLGAAGIDRIDATDNAVTVSLAQSNAYASAGIALAAADAVTLADAGATLGGLATSQIAVLGARGVDRIDATDNAVTVSLAQSNAYAAAGIALAAADAITLSDTGATLGSRTASQIATLGAAGIDRIDATDNALTVSLAQSNAYASVGIALAAADAVTLADAGATLRALTTAQISTLDARGVDKVDATDGALSLGLAQVNAFGSAGIALAAADTVTLADTGAVLRGLTAAQVADLGVKGIDRIDATDNAAAFTVAEFDALAANGIRLAAGDTITLADGPAAIGALTPAEIEALRDIGLDLVDVVGNAVTLRLDSYDAFGGVRFAASDTVTVVGSGQADVITSRGADMVFDGNGGNDRLVGGGGEDIFRIDTALGAKNVDTIRSFDVKADEIALDDAVFKALDAGALSARAFVIGDGAGDATDRIIYDKTTGALFYDRDGDGDAAAMKIAMLEKGLALHHDDFFIV